jgi:hypothetical protein
MRTALGEKKRRQTGNRAITGTGRQAKECWPLGEKRQRSSEGGDERKDSVRTVPVRRYHWTGNKTYVRLPFNGARLIQVVSMTELGVGVGREP